MLEILVCTNIPPFELFFDDYDLSLESLHLTFQYGFFFPRNLLVPKLIINLNRMMIQSGFDPKFRHKCETIHLECLFRRLAKLLVSLSI